MTETVTMYRAEDGTLWASQELAEAASRKQALKNLIRDAYFPDSPDNVFSYMMADEAIAVIASNLAPLADVVAQYEALMAGQTGP